MPVIDLFQEAGQLQALLQADGVCYWRTDADGVAMPVGCSPAGWLSSGFLMPPCHGDPAGHPIRLVRGAEVLAHLPFILRATLDEPPAALLLVRCGPLAGWLAVWRDDRLVPSQVLGLADLARSAYEHHLAYNDTVDLARESHLQLRGVMSALPQGVVIVPNRSRRGFVNTAAAAFLRLDEGEVEVGALSAALTCFAERALNASEVLDHIRLFTLGQGQPVLRGCVWRFAAEPQALRVTVAPIGSNAADGWVWLLDDISVEERAKALLTEREEKLRLFYQGLQDAVVFTDLTGRMIEWNAAFRDLLGYTDAQLADMTMAEITPEIWRAKLEAQIAAGLLANGHVGRYEKGLRRADGRTILVEASTFVRKDERGQPVALWKVVRDITERKSAEAQLILAAQMFDRATDGVILTDPTQTILTANDAFAVMVGYSRDELKGQTPALFRSGLHDDGFYGAMQVQLDANGWWQGEIWNRKKNGDIFLRWLSITAVRDDSGALTHYIQIFRDLAIVQQSHERIEYLATHDELTGLPNRTLFADRFNLALARAARLDRPLALLYLDLDEFKAINETLGHKVGDVLLVEAARRLTGVIRQEDTVARHGGDEFVILLEGQSLEVVASVCEAVLASLGALYQLEALQAAVSVSIGISVFPADGCDAETLLRKADTALYRAKSQGKNTYRFFTEDMADHVSQQLRIESNLRQALAHNELRLVYQPQISLDGEHLVGCEALLRWRQGAEMVPPDLFIPIAERSALIIDITAWVFTEVCRQIRQWDASGLAVHSVSVNISARHFKQSDMVPRLKAVVDQAQVAPSRLCLEITEGALMDPVRCERTLADLKAAGFRMSLDDFGTGYSSLAYLKRFPIDELKVDRSFVNGIESEESDCAIVAATLSMAHSLGMRVVAEGVETPLQLRYLQGLGCDIVQGYLFSRPLAPDDFFSYARDHMRAPG